MEALTVWRGASSSTKASWSTPGGGSNGLLAEAQYVTVHPEGTGGHRRLVVTRGLCPVLIRP